MTGHASGQVSSPAVTAVARTCTSTSPGPGRGTGTLSYRRLAGSALEARMACMVSGALFMAIFLTLAGPGEVQVGRVIFSQAQRPDGPARPVPVRDILPAPGLASRLTRYCPELPRLFRGGGVAAPGAGRRRPRSSTTGTNSSR